MALYSTLATHLHGVKLRHSGDISFHYHFLYNTQVINDPCVVQTRALKLQQTKQKAALHRQQQRELQLQRETDLIAKPSSSCGEKGKSS